MITLRNLDKIHWDPNSQQILSSVPGANPIFWLGWETSGYSAGVTNNAPEVKVFLGFRASDQSSWLWKQELFPHFLLCFSGEIALLRYGFHEKVRNSFTPGIPQLQGKRRGNGMGISASCFLHDVFGVYSVE